MKTYPKEGESQGASHEVQGEQSDQCGANCRAFLGLWQRGAKDKRPAVSYPAALEGVWLGGGAQYCKHPDSLDSDSRFEITPTKRVGYEDWSEPVRVTLISRDPMAWKVHSKLHIDESTFDIVQIMLLGSGGRVLTVVSDGHSMTYFRCH